MLPRSKGDVHRVGIVSIFFGYAGGTSVLEASSSQLRVTPTRSSDGEPIRAKLRAI